MIVYLAKRQFTDTVTPHLKTYLRPIRSRIRVLEYERLANLAEIPAATYIFTDFERMNSDEVALAQQVFESIRTQRPDLRLLNEPRRAVRRFHLLRKLQECGLNRHRVVRIHELDDTVRYPVFVRLENDHFGPRSNLIESREELERVLLLAVAGGAPLDQLMVVEFADTRREDGLCVALGATSYGDVVVPRHKVFRASWLVKAPDSRAGDKWPQSLADEEMDYLNSTVPDSVRQAFDLAGLDYGRIDYSPTAGHLNVWEINSNPMMMVIAERILPVRAAAVERMGGYLLENLIRLDEKGPAGPGIRLSLSVPAGHGVTA